MPPETRAEPPLLAVEDLEIGFRTELGFVVAVSDVSFEVRAREILGVVGESGSGKTLTLLAVMGLITDPNARLRGSIRFRGRELLGLGRHAWRRLRGREIAMIFQDPLTAMTPVLGVGWQIDEQLRAHEPLSRAGARRRTVELLGAVGIADPRDVAERYPHQLSGGMRQRAMIAMALACDPALLLADEPTTALDVTVQAQILELVLRLRDEIGSAVVIVTHDMGVVARVADRAVVMYAGRVVERASRAELFDEPRHPYTIGLLASIPPLDGPRPRRLRQIPGSPPTPGAWPSGCSFNPRCAFREDRCGVERPPLVGASGHEAACLLVPKVRARTGEHEPVIGNIA